MQKESDFILSVLIVNYNGKKFLGSCLAAIQKYVNVSHEIILIDNASQDGSVDFLKANYPQVKIIQSHENLGFAAGNNLVAIHARGKYLLLLNNDTEIQKPIKPLVDRLDNEPKVGVIGCHLIYADGRPQESIGYFPTVWSLILSWLPLAKKFPNLKCFRRLVRFDSQLYRQSCAEVDWVSGAFFLTRADLWRKLQGMDANYFMYMEDTDYCLRAHREGEKILYSTDCKVIHYEGAGKSWLGEAAIMNSVCSYLIYFNKFHGKISVLILRSLLPIIFLFRSFCHLMMWGFGLDREGSGKAKSYFLASFFLIKNKRGL